MPEHDGAIAASREKRQLFWAFNFLPSTYCHASWLPPGLDDARIGGRDSPEHPCHRYLSPWLLTQWGLDRHFELDFHDPASRIALLNAEAIERLGLMLALLGRQDVLRRTVQREALQAIKAACELDDIGVLLLRPERFRLLDMAGQPNTLDPASITALRTQGRGFVWSLLSPQSKAVRKRFLLKLPSAASASRAKRLVSRDQTSALAAWTVECLIPKVLPQWAWLF